MATLSSTEVASARLACLRYAARNPGAVLEGDMQALLEALSSSDADIVRAQLAIIEALDAGLSSASPKGALKAIVGELEWFEGRLGLSISERDSAAAVIVQLLGLLDSSGGTWAAASEAERSW